MANYGNCRSCGADVEWVQTEAGKRMPVDAEPVANGNIVKVRGNLIRYLGKGEVFTGDRWVSHFATCAQAGSWRKP